MAFTSSIFLFVFFPLCLGGYYLAAGVERGVAALRRLRLPTCFWSAQAWCFTPGRPLMGRCGWWGMCCWPFCSGASSPGCQRGRRCGCWRRGARCWLMVLMLVYFKYYNFSVTTVNRLFSLSIATRSIVAPLGVSFITFSAVSYFVDISRGDAKPGSLLDTALYLTFFPKVHLRPDCPVEGLCPLCQRAPERRFDSALFLQGLNRIVIGFAKS